MQLQIKQEHLIRALINTSRIISLKAQMPILGHVLLTADASGLTVSATNLELGLCLRVGAKVDAPGSLTVPAKVFTELISNCGVGNLELSADQTELSITGSHVKARLSGMAAAEFPVLPQFTDPPLIELPSDTFSQAVDRVAFATALDDTRPVLTAIQLKSVDQNLELAGTDGFRLSWIQIPRAISSSEKLELLVPARALSEVVKLLDPSITTIKCSLTDKSSQIIFKIGESELVSRLVSGDFPDFHKIMPSGGDTSIEFDRGELMRAVKLAAIFARESANIVKLSFSGDLSSVAEAKVEASAKADVLITANAPQVGGEESTIDAKIDGPPAEIAFNYRYLLDYLSVGNSPSVKLLMTTALGPGLWLEMPSSTSKDKESRGTALQYKHVIMPVRLEASSQE